MKILVDIPVKLGFDNLLQKLHLAPASDEAQEFSELFEKAILVAAPKAAYSECFIETKDDKTITIAGQVLTSTVLRQNIGDVQRVFPYVATCGTELDEIEIDSDDFLQQFWLDAIKAEVLDISRTYLKDYIHSQYPHLKTTSMSPGSGDIQVWPIEEQKPLFAILGDVKNAIGVTLTDSLLMQPNKSLSGIRYPSEIDFRTCQLCHKENCPTRQLPLNEELIEKYAH
jgi:hypothetical protein